MSIRAHGGAIRYWRHEKNGLRAVLCADGKVLVFYGGRWKERGDIVSRSLLDTVSEWKTDTRPTVTAAVTRTGREARRSES